MEKNFICGIGNALVDSEYKVNDDDLNRLGLKKGCMELNDSKNHISLTNELKAKYGVVKMMPGGSVANTLYALAQFKQNVTFIGRVSRDDVGNNFINSLQDIDVTTSIKQVNSGITGECVVLITPDHERTMFTHLGVSAELSINDINDHSIINAEYLLVEGYLVTSDETRDVANHCLDIANKNNIKKIITLSDPNVVSFFRDNMMTLMDKKFDIIFCNREEAMNISQSENIDDAIRFLQVYSNEIIITSGEDGAYVSHNESIIHIEGESANPVDLTGAGDMFLAAYMFAKIRRKKIVESVTFANKCASKIIQIYGAKFDDENEYKKLMTEL